MSGDSQKLLELVERCEKADRASRELDAEIWTAVHGQDMYWSIQIVNDDWRLRYYPGPPGPEYHALKRYTASLDAALTLVPEGFRWKLGYSRHVPCVAEIVDYRIQMEPNLGRFVSECDNSHALALVAAALRARAAQIEPPVCECDNAEVDGCPIHWK